jgi:hypothetical protein
LFLFRMPGSSMDEEDDSTRPWPQPSAEAPVPVPVPVAPGPVRAGPAGAAERAAMQYGGSALPAGFVLGGFEIESVLGEGGFSIVYRARDRQLRRQVALKEYMPGALALRNPDFRVAVKSERVRETFQLGLRSFVKEARMLGRFEHPALVKVLGYWEEHGTAYMAMPCYEGITLKRMLRLPDFHATEDWLREILAPLLDAIEMLHGAHCFHRDISPDNILILPNGAPLLLDFGAARQVIGDHSQALTAILKPGYAPIEQYGESATMRQGPWTDIYAISAVLYFAVTGLVPAPSVGRMMNDELLPAAKLARPGYSDRFLSAIRAGLAVRPRDRPQSIADLRRLLDLHPPPAARAPLALMREAPMTPLRSAPGQAAAGRPARPAATIGSERRVLVPAGDRVTAPPLAHAASTRGPQRGGYRIFASLAVASLVVAAGVWFLSGLSFPLFSTLAWPVAAPTATSNGAAAPASISRPAPAPAPAAPGATLPPGPTSAVAAIRSGDAPPAAVAKSPPLPASQFAR